MKQAAIADRLLVTKLDLAPAGAGELRGRLETLNPGAALFEVENGEVDPAMLFGAGPFDPEGRSEKAREWLAAERYDSRAHGHHHHDADIRSVSLVHEAPLDWGRFQRWLGALRQEHADKLLRIKGILDVAGEAGPLVIHGVHDTFHPPVVLARWPDADRRSRLVIIARGLDRAGLEPGWREVAAPT
jgi:G3E family GTPase